MTRFFGLFLCVACGAGATAQTSTAPADPALATEQASTGQASTGQASPARAEAGPEADVRRVFAAQARALEDRSAEEFLANFMADERAVFVGPVDAAFLTGTAVSEGVTRVFETLPVVEVRAEEHGMGVAGDDAWTAHHVDLRLVDAPAGAPEVVHYHATQLYHRSEDRWRAVAAAWFIRLDSPGTAEPPALEVSVDDGCEAAATLVEAHRAGGSLSATRTLEPGAGFAPESVSAGPGGIRARRSGEYCFVVTNLRQDNAHLRFVGVVQGERLVHRSDGWILPETPATEH
ncbi:MAG: nuclear transport factor 2 family protein [Myxococcota bacterium]